MSKTSKILLFTSAALPFAAYAISYFGYELESGEVPPGIPKEDWHEMLSHFHSTGYYNNWDIIAVVLVLASFASIICALLFWNYDKPTGTQKLFTD
ncbi:MAG: hypothetical protein AB7U82_30875 [Blastocatellales bacterium]